MKLHPLAAAAAVLVCGNSAFAAASPDFYLAGSSALKNVVAKAIGNNCSSVTTYNGVKNTPAAGPLDTADGQSFVRYACTVSSANTWGLPSSNTLNIYLNTQGSAYGVFPVAANSPVGFIDPASCGVTGLTATQCNAVVQHVPDAGLSDLEPTFFNDISNHPVQAQANAPVGTTFPTLFTSAAPITPSSFDSSQVAAAQVFGLAVNNALLAALRADQGLSSSQTPTVSSSAFATIYAPGYGLSGLGWTPFFSNGGGAVTNQVNICSRLPGSGTRASAQAFFLQKPFSSTAQDFATAANDNQNDTSTLSDGIGLNNSGGYEIAEYDNSAAVVGCLTSSAGYAIGLLSTDRASGGTTATDAFTFVNLDGSVPNASAAKFGKYQWVYEAYYNVNRASSNKTFANAFYNAFKTPANIQALGAPGTNGLMGAVANCTAPYTAGSAAAAVCSHVTRGGNSSTVLRYAQ